MFNLAVVPEVMREVAYSQITNAVLMIRPAHFRWNVQTADDNIFQQRTPGLSDEDIQGSALREFDNLVEKLRAHQIQVVVFQSDDLQDTPDSIFPNNWVSFHNDGSVALFPMLSQSRRRERRMDIIRNLADQHGFNLRTIKDYSSYELEHKFLEGTGSMVLDRENRNVYAALSHRTNRDVLDRFCLDFNYNPVIFRAFTDYYGKRVPIYHTNVMMNVGEGFAVICAQSIDDPHQRTTVIQNLEKSGKEVVLISEDQNGRYAGNMLQLYGLNNERFLIMSDQAFDSLDMEQLGVLRKHTKIIHSGLNTIESIGGGSARCMIAEIFLPTE